VHSFRSVKRLELIRHWSQEGDFLGLHSVQADTL
jgi:hypothetical protein